MSEDREVIGGNNPPSQIDFSRETAQALSDWMRDNPVVQTEESARDGKALCDRASLCLNDMRDERDALTRPLNEQLTAIHSRYREPQNTLSRVLTELTARINAFIIREEERRNKIAIEAEAALREAERIAREAEETEQQAIADAKEGVADADVAVLVREADEKFSRFRDASNAALRAKRATKVKIGGGFRRAHSLRGKEVLTVEDAGAAIAAMGLTNAISNAILKEARSFRKTFGELPAGITSTTERG
jgi:hypothetical protein